ncbi:bifunctional dihydrofolate reductase-thymidylate synthase 1 [Physcomitrium patens]|uniref:bifunctional dihydrofolate reductase-thymidylate synthase 1 n=1 Tax=Physcomitrium patens TaxID=3218 RepID=UPI00024AC70A|nr:bifunctional dihydrofolate reductase-thymidylate synthase 1-like [Physcomitrium patens]|eukprot:XP_024394486.1 bifunctional dihydrofolate reductase-thymidylate synthase 1-like [Physcomitrella patens]
MKLVVRGWKCSFRVLSCPGPTCSEVPKGVIRHIAHCSTERSFASSERATFCDVRLGRIERCDMRFSSSCIFRSQVGGLASGLSGCCSVPPPLGSIDTDRLSFPGIGLRGFSSETAGMASSGSPAPECDEGEQILSGTHSEKLRGFQIVVAATRERGIGKQGHLPWKLPTDMKFFKTVTSVTTSSSKKNAVIMGRHTWESIPEKFRPLPGRLNVILTRSGIKSTPAGVVVSESLQSALALIATPSYSSHVESVFVIGGGQVYSEAMASPLCEVIHLTEVEGDVECDTYMPAVDTDIFRIWSASIPIVENGLRISFLTYVRGSLTSSIKQTDNGETTVGLLPKYLLEAHDEYQYLNLIDDIIKTGAVKGDRTGTGTISKFGCQMRFNLRKSFPLLTTKRVFWRGVVEELLWFISGSTNAKVLHDKGVKIWDGNGSREYLDKQGLTEREEGDLGPVYGFQWRHFGAKYVDMHADYTGQGYDQLKDVINKIKTDPDDRRILLSAWNPADLKLMALPPCHMFAQFYVANGELSCQMYQRSCDMGLGVPFNIASYALLTCILAHVCDLVPGDFVHVLGDAHVYKNHVEPLQEQLQNTPMPFPRLRIKTANRDIDSFVAADFELIGYKAHQKINMIMAV